MKKAISCIPSDLKEGCLDTLGIFGFESLPTFDVTEAFSPQYTWIYSDDISDEDAKIATALCFGYCYGRDDGKK